MHTCSNLRCGVDSTAGHGLIPADLFETLAAKQLHSTSHTVQSYILTDKLIADRGVNHATSQSEPGISRESFQDLLEVRRLECHVCIKVANKGEVEMLNAIQSGVEGADLISKMPTGRSLQIHHLNERMSRCLCFNQFLGAVRGCVVHDHPLQWSNRLRRH